MQHQPHYFGRGRVHFTAPLSSTGAVDTSADASWGSNWPAAPALPSSGILTMPPGRFIGNSKTLTLTPQVQELNVPDYTADGNGEDAYLIEGVAGNLVVLAHGARNLADALYTLVRQSAGAALQETLYVADAQVPQGAMLFSREVLDVQQPVSVVPSWGAWAEGIHWERDPLGIRVLQGFAAPANATISLGYTSEGEAYWVEAFQRPRVTLGLVFAGVNRHTNAPTRVDCYRAVIKPMEDFQVIREATGEIRFSFRLRPVRPPMQSSPKWFRLMNGRAAHG